MIGDRYRPQGEIRSADRRLCWARDEQTARPALLVETLGAPGIAPAEASVRRAAQAASAARNPYLLAPISVVTEGSTVWLVHEGAGLSRLLAEALTDPTTDPVRLVAWARELADGLAAAHRAGVAHRDLHAGLVFLDEAGSARLAGLGATSAAGAGRAVHVAPEVRAGAQASPAADVYALAALLRTARQARSEWPAAGARLAELDAVLADATADDPARRPSALAVRDRLAALLPVPVAPGPPPSSVPAPPPSPVPGLPPSPVPAARPESPTGPPGPPSVAWPTPPFIPEQRGYAEPPAGLGPLGYFPSGHPPPAGHPLPGYTPPPGFPSPGPLAGYPLPVPSRGGRHTGWLLLAGAAALVVVLVGLGGALLPVLRSVSTPPRSPEPESLLGDPRTADPCSLLDPAQLASIGRPFTLPDYVFPSACAIGVSQGNATITVSAQLWAPTPESPDGVPRQDGQLRVYRLSSVSEGCPSTIVLPDNRQVRIVVQLFDGANADMCGLADAATTTAVTVLTSHQVHRRVEVDPPSSLRNLDQCALYDPDTLATVPGLNQSRMERGLNGWSCRWGHNPASPDTPQVFSQVITDMPGAGQRTTVAGRSAVVRPGLVGPDPGLPVLGTCTIDIDQRAFTTPGGLPEEESLEISVYESSVTPTDQVCELVTRIAGVVVPRLPAR